MNRSLPLLMIVLTSSVVMAQDPAARTVQVHSQDIVPIRAKLKYTTLIEVPATEKIMKAAHWVDFDFDRRFYVDPFMGNARILCRAGRLLIILPCAVCGSAERSRPMRTEHPLLKSCVKVR